MSMLVLVYCDNKIFTFITNNTTFYEHVKYLKLDYDFIKDVPLFERIL